MFDEKTRGQKSRETVSLRCAQDEDFCDNIGDPRELGN
jgi:hypothetical protein